MNANISSPPGRTRRPRRHTGTVLAPLVVLAFFAFVASAQAHFANATTACSATSGNTVTFLWWGFPNPPGPGNGGENTPQWQIVYTPAGGSPTTLSGQVTFPSGHYSLTVQLPGAAGSAVASSTWSSSQTTDGSQGSSSATLTIPNCLATPAITTTASATVAAGGAISDQATLRGGSAPTGTITFKLYAATDTACSTVLATAATPVSGSGTYTSPPVTESQAGDYQWTASYSGDANNAPAADSCNERGEQVVVARAAPSLATIASPGVLAGGPIFDAGVLTGGVSPTGTITFTLYSASDTTCANPLSTGTTAVHGNGAYSSPVITESHAGAYLWRAGYSGDANNIPVNETCGDASEHFKVTAAPPQAVASCSTFKPSLLGIAAKVGNSAVTARVPALGIKSVTFYLDHRKLKTMTKPHHGVFSIRIKTGHLAYGGHMVTAKTRSKLKLCKPVSLHKPFIRYDPNPPAPTPTG